MEEPDDRSTDANQEAPLSIQRVDFVQIKPKGKEPFCQITAEKLFKTNLVNSKHHYRRIDKFDVEPSEILLPEELEKEDDNEEDIEEDKKEKKDKKDKPKKKPKVKNSAQKVFDWIRSNKVLSDQISEIQSIALSSNGKIAFLAATGNPNVFCCDLNGEGGEVKCKSTTKSVSGANPQTKSTWASAARRSCTCSKCGIWWRSSAKRSSSSTTAAGKSRT